jgi:hypothetical protein
MCVTPSGYIVASWSAAKRANEASDRRQRAEASVSFLAAAKTVAETHGSLPVTRHLDAELACRGTTALISWVDAEQRALGRLSCTPSGCEPSAVKLPGIDTTLLLLLAELGERTLLLWREPSGELRVRIGAFGDLARSPSAPLWQGERPLELMLAGDRARAIAVGDSVLVLVESPALSIAQIHADGRLEWLPLTLSR